MHAYQTHTIESAPTHSKAALEGLKKNFGLVPNLAATMAESPTLVNGFVGALVNFISGSFTGAQRQTVLLTNAVVNRCAWAVAFHSTAALGEGVSATDVDAIRSGALPSEPSLRALSSLGRALVEKRGHLDPADREMFHAAGFSPAQLLEVIAGIGASLMANYAGNITNPPVEAPFRAQTWTR